MTLALLHLTQAAEEVLRLSAMEATVATWAEPRAVGSSGFVALISPGL